MPAWSLLRFRPAWAGVRDPISNKRHPQNCFCSVFHDSLLLVCMWVSSCKEWWIMSTLNNVFLLRYSLITKSILSTILTLGKLYLPQNLVRWAQVSSHHRAALRLLSIHWLFSGLWWVKGTLAWTVRGQQPELECPSCLCLLDYEFTCAPPSCVEANNLWESGLSSHHAGLSGTQTWGKLGSKLASPLAIIFRSGIDFFFISKWIKRFMVYMMWCSSVCLHCEIVTSGWLQKWGLTPHFCVCAENIEELSKSAVKTEAFTADLFLQEAEAVLFSL